MKNQKLNDYCKNIRNQYQDYISLEQFRIICKIAKRTASSLLTNGIVPAIDTGKKTCRYRIKVDDVIKYLRSLETVNRITSTGIITSKIVSPKILKKTYIDFLSEIPDDVMLNYLEYIYNDYPDVMTTAHIAVITGLIENTIQNYAKKGIIRAFKIGRTHRIPKPYAYEFLVSKKFIESISSAEYLLKFSHDLESWMERSDFIGKEYTGTA